MLNERELESAYLGQFIPVQYHHHLLADTNRMDGFKAAIARHVFAGAKVLELGGGTGVLSWFAAQTAAKVYCVEFNPDMVEEARRLLALNVHGDKVEIIHADAFEYLPPEPVDVVICEMVHGGLLREKQLEVIEHFKQRYLEKFGIGLPVFIPEAVVMAVQPLQQTYDFGGYQAPVIQFQEPGAFYADTLELAQPALYSVIDFDQNNAMQIQWHGQFSMERKGKVSALRFVTKSILAVLMETSSTIDWLHAYMVLPLPESFDVRQGDVLEVSFEYRAGGSISSLQKSLQVKRKPAALARAGHLSLVHG
ncbi:methyltransferase domain-containing protein [Undibacterium sp. SXout7W]|uniref:methyltransferase domain-containing protein n=1 Tax=Undibacterium sp. SXout7W TaxID=3413049 RepID=UPI003BF40C96